MGCSNSITLSGTNQRKNIIVQEQEVEEVKEERPNSFHGFSEEEVNIVQNLLNKDKYEPDDVIGYKATIEFNSANMYYKEYLIVQTGKKDGQKYSGKYKFKSKIVKGNNLKSHIFINKTPIDSIKVKTNKYDYEDLEIEIDYNLNENDNSIITILIDTDSKTEMIQAEYEVYFLVIYFSSFSNSFFKLDVKCSDEFYFSNIGYNTKNKFEVITKRELILSGIEYETNSFHFRYDNGQIGYVFNDNMKYFYNCDKEELLSLQIAANSVGLIYLDKNIFGIKDIYNISPTRECEVKTIIYLIYPTKTNSNTSANFFFELEQNSVQLIKSKINNVEEERTKVINLGDFDAINVYISLKNEQFCTVELDYKFKLKDIRDTNPKFYYNLCINIKIY